MDNPIPEHLRCDDLLLLVGTNPLPNWVAARLLLNAEGRAHLVHTSGVKEQANRLKRILEEEKNITVGLIETSDSDDAKIFQDVYKLVKGLRAASSRKIGLNYTGGTKMMSVHAHRAMHALKLGNWLSYLDARTLSLKFDNFGGIYPINLASEIRISLEKLLSLHENYEPRNVTYDTSSKYANAARWLVDIHSEDSGLRVWRDWCIEKKLTEGINRQRLKRDLGYYRQVTNRLAQVRLLEEAPFNREVENHLRKNKLPPQAVQMHLNRIAEGYRKLLAELSIAGGDSLAEVVSRNPQFKDSIEAAGWLDGKWLEHYTFSKIEECRREADLNADGLLLNLDTINTEKREFEADVIALRGYQLFYFSCYSGSNPKAAKQKLFEAMVRASQLGGDEARFALVSNVDHPDNLRKQVEANWQSSGQVEVFGRNSLLKLKEDLKEWLTRKPKNNKEYGQ